MKVDLSENLVDINQLVSFLNVSLSEVKDWIDQGIIPAETYIKVGNTYRFQLSAVVEALQSQNTQENTNQKPVKETIEKDKDLLSFEELEIASENGDLKATYELGKCYELGKGTEINTEEAFLNYQISALHGFEGAYLDLARCFEKGIGTNVNLQEAKKFRELISKKPKQKSTEKPAFKDKNSPNFKDSEIVNLKIVGMKHRSAVTSHQLTSLKEYEIKLLKEPTNRFDRNAIQCIAFEDEETSFHFGYIERINSVFVTKLLDKYKSYKVKLTEIGKMKIKCQIQFFNEGGVDKPKINKSEDKSQYQQLMEIGINHFENSNYQKALDAFLICHKNNFKAWKTIKTKEYPGRSPRTRQGISWMLMRCKNGATVREIMDASGIHTPLRIRAMISEWRKEFKNEYGPNFIITHNKKSLINNLSNLKGKDDKTGYEILRTVKVKTFDFSYEIGLCNYRLGKFLEAFVFFVESSEKNDNPEAQYMMGVMLFFGQHDTMDRKKAQTYFEMAADQNHEDARSMLEENYFQYSRVVK